jgi:hypothetical protein
VIGKRTRVLAGNPASNCVMTRFPFARLTLVVCLLSVGWLTNETATADDNVRKPASNIALQVGKIFTCVGDPISDGTILIKDGKIEAIGSRKDIKIPDGYEVIDHSDRFAMPGLVEAHSHVGGSGDLNEMVYQTNPELRNWDQITPHNDRLKVAIAGGVTTICCIPGSGTNMGGFGVLMKTNEYDGDCAYACDSFAMASISSILSGSFP